MNFGFFGVQFSFGLQQSNMSAIYRYLGAEESELPVLWLAGPVTGLVVQPIIGAISDGTWSPKFGRRKPFFLLGAIIASLALIAMPYSSSIWMAAGLLWILDAANNIALEPYRAFISDKLPKKQFSFGFLVQSFFTGLGTTVANFTPAILVSFGILACLAAWIAVLSLGFIPGSLSPNLAATVISLESFENIFDLSLSALPFLCFIPAQCECPAIINLLNFLHLLVS